MKASEALTPRRQPKQERARQTVEAVLEAVPLVLKRHGAAAITTNRVAEAAGVSIGSLYQYFPDKQAIFSALHERHVAAVRQVIEETLSDCAFASVAEFTGELVERLANVHAQDAELHQVLSAAVPGSADGFKGALQATFERVLSSAERECPAGEQAERMLFVLPPLVEALVHGVADQPQPLARARAKDEALRTVAVYLASYQDGHAGRY